MGKQAQDKKARRRATALSIVLSSLGTARKLPQARKVPLPAGRAADSYTQAELQTLAADALDAGFVVTDDYHKAVTRSILLLRGLYGIGAFSIDPDMYPCPVYVPHNLVQHLVREKTLPHRDGVKLLTHLAATDNTTKQAFIVSEGDTAAKIETLNLVDDDAFNRFDSLFFRTCGGKWNGEEVEFGLLELTGGRVMVQFYGGQVDAG